MILQLSAIWPQCKAPARGRRGRLSGWVIPTDKGGMRPSRSYLTTIGLGLAVLAISLAKLSDVAHTAFALFLATVILVDCSRSRTASAPASRCSGSASGLPPRSRSVL